MIAGSGRGGRNRTETWDYGRREGGTVGGEEGEGGVSQRKM